jgi:hypothetical protein
MEPLLISKHIYRETIENGHRGYIQSQPEEIQESLRDYYCRYRKVKRELSRLLNQRINFYESSESFISRIRLIDDYRKELKYFYSR